MPALEDWGGLGQLRTEKPDHGTDRMPECTRTQQNMATLFGLSSGITPIRWTGVRAPRV